MTDHDKQKAEYLNSWKVFFLKTLGWSETRVSEWMRRTGKDRLLDDAESWLYHDPPVVWAVEALLSHVLPEQLSSKAVTVARNEILRGFAEEKYQISLKSDWPLHRRRINHALEGHGTQLPRAVGSPLTQLEFPESSIRHGEGASFAPGSDASRATARDQFVPKKPSNRSAVTFSSHRTSPGHLIVREFVGV